MQGSRGVAGGPAPWKAGEAPLASRRAMRGALRAAEDRAEAGTQLLSTNSHLWSRAVDLTSKGGNKWLL